MAHGADRVATALGDAPAMESDLRSQDLLNASLGIGFDVFPQAYGFAAGRVGAPADLTILSCKELRCHYSLGAGVMLSTDHLPERLDIHRVEASLDVRRSREPAVRFQYEQVCLTIVALVDPRASRDEQQATASAISTFSGETARPFRLGPPDRRVRVYGLHAAETAPSATALRCGAVAVR